MPSALTYPGVYVEEIPSGVRTIVGVGTSIAAFVGRAARGPVNKAVVINSFGDFERRFGGIWGESTLGFAVRDFFLNGGSQAIIVRLYHATPGSTTAEAGLVAEGKAAADPIIKAAKDRLGEKPPADIQDIIDAIAPSIAGGMAGGGVVALVAQRLSEVAQAATRAEAGRPTVDSVSLAARLAVEKYSKKADPDTVTALKAVGDAADEAAKSENPTVNDILVACTKACAALTGIPAPALEVANDALQDIALATQKGPDKVRPEHVVAALDNASARVIKAAATQAAKQPSTAVLTWGDLVLEAASEGAWGNELRFRVDLQIDPAYAEDKKIALADLFNIEIFDKATGASEYFRNLTVAGPRPIGKVLEYESDLVRVSSAGATPPPHPDARKPKPWYDDENYATSVTSKVGDGENLDLNDIIASQDDKEGIYALDDVDLFNLLCIPPLAAPGAEGADVPDTIWATAAAYCQRRRALLVIDPPFNPANAEKDKIRAYVENLRGAVSANARNAAFFYPSILATSPKTGQPEAFAPCGAVAGVFARTDTTRGVWKAPAGIEAGIVGTVGLATTLTDGENGDLNPIGINCLRSLPSAGRIVWGSRTLAGDDRLASEWKYIPVRRTALYIEESLYRGTHWVVFEPNDEPLWGQIRLNVGAFMNDLYRKGAFQGQTPGAAYFVKCDKETNPQNDIDKGIVNIHVGFAPLKPAEFVVIKLQQIAGQILT